MHIDWRREVNDATAVKIVCEECEQEVAVAIRANGRLLCRACAEALGQSGREVSYEKILHQVLLDMRGRLDDWAGLLERSCELRRQGRGNNGVLLEDRDWNRLVERYRRLEEYYLALHRVFRRRDFPIPDPGWRSTYVERVINCGYTSKLGD